MTDPELRVNKIRHGTVVDHVPGGQALNVLRLLGIDGSEGTVVSIAMNVPSDRLARKDILKIEAREVNQDEVDVLSMIAPRATINIIADYDVVDKRRVERPERVSGILNCPNPACITATDEPIESHFDVLEDGVRCRYCGTIVRDDLAEHLTPHA